MVKTTGTSKAKWLRPHTENSVSYEDVLDSIQRLANPEVKGVPVTYKIYVGTDTQRKGSNYKMITSIAVRRFNASGYGNGGVYFYTKQWFSHLQNLKLKMISEAGQTLLTAYQLKEDLAARGIEIPIEIHFDVSPNSESKIALPDIRQMARGSGFTWKIKPEAWAASSVSNKHSK